MDVDDGEVLGRVRAARRAMLTGETEMAYTLMASIEHLVAYGLDSLDALLTRPFVESVAAFPTTGVQTAEKALADVVKRSRTPRAGPTTFVLIVSGSVEGATTAEMFTSASNDSEHDRLVAWLGSTPDLGEPVAQLLRRFSSTRD